MNNQMCPILDSDPDTNPVTSGTITYSLIPAKNMVVARTLFGEQSSTIAMFFFSYQQGKIWKKPAESADKGWQRLRTTVGARKMSHFGVPCEVPGVQMQWIIR